MNEPKVARDAEKRGEGICRTCLAPIWNEGGTIGREKRDTGWSDRIKRGGDSLVCFRAVDYRHVPLTGREAEIYDVALARRSETVFEKAHTPTDDEREALLDDDGWPVAPVVDVVMKRWSNDNDTIRRGDGGWSWKGLAETAIQALAQAGLLRRTVQGDYYEGFEEGVAVGRRTLQGEPTDAQCDDAIRAFHTATLGDADPEFLTEQRLTRMRDPWRAALRAAGVVPVQGEPESTSRDEADAMYPLDGSSPDVIFALRSAYRAGAAREGRAALRAVQAPEGEEN